SVTLLTFPKPPKPLVESEAFGLRPPNKLDLLLLSEPCPKGETLSLFFLTVFEAFGLTFRLKEPPIPPKVDVSFFSPRSEALLTLPKPNPKPLVESEAFGRLGFPNPLKEVTFFSSTGFEYEVF